MRSNQAYRGTLDPQDTTQPHSSICATGLVPALLLTGAFLDILRRKFAEADNIMEPSLKDQIWVGKNDNATTDVTKSKIYIEPHNRWDPAGAEKRPALLVKRNGTQARRISINNEYHSYRPALDDREGDHYPIDSGRLFELLLISSYTVFCVAREAAEAETLGVEVFLHLVEFAPIIQKELDLVRLAPMDIGAVAKLEESKEHWVLPVPIACAYKHSWRLIPQGQPLKTVHLSTE